MRFDFLRRTARPLLASFIFAAMLGPAAPGASAQDAPQPDKQTQEPSAQTQTSTPAQQPPAAEPLYTEFKGVKIGTSRDEARKEARQPAGEGQGSGLLRAVRQAASATLLRR